jgi:uncharacterized RDD family membrane protein YckC
MEDISTAAPAATIQQVVYAGFWRRFAAYFIDSTILKLLFLPFALLFLRDSGLWDLFSMFRKLPEGSTDLIGIMNPEMAILIQSLFRKLMYFGAIHSLFTLIYYSIWESSGLRATPGKLATGIKVSDANGNRLSFIRALGRNFCKVFSAIIFMIGYMMAGWTEKKQALHDLICNCVVTKSETVHEPVQVFAYAGFWRRFVAWLLDVVLLAILLSPITILFTPNSLKNLLEVLRQGIQQPHSALPNINDIMQYVLVRALTALIIFFYYASWESSRYQGTPGKLAIGIKVVDLNGNRISFWRAAGRYISKLLSNLTLLVGYMMAGWTKHKQALHDELAHCLVIKGGQ